LVGVGELRHRLRVHERGHFDPLEASGAEQVDEAHLDVSRDARPFILQPIAWPDLDDAHLRHGSDSSGSLARSSSVAPAGTWSPTRTQTSRTTPAWGASTTCSIFIASSTTRGSFERTCWPGWTAILTMRPGMGAVSCPARPPPRLAAVVASMLSGCARSRR